MLSVSQLEEKRMRRQNIIYRNWIACLLSDVVFVPFAEKGTKTLSMAKKIFSNKIPIFTTDHEENKLLHQLGIPGLSRKSVGGYLEKLGARRAQLSEKENKKFIVLDSTPKIENKMPKFLQEKFNF